MCTLYHFPRHSGERASAFAAPVAPIEEDVEADERKKREVGPDHPVVAVEDLVDDAEDISELDQQHEPEALALRRLRLQRLRNRKRPRKAETAQHQKFKKSHRPSPRLIPLAAPEHHVVAEVRVRGAPRRQARQDVCIVGMRPDHHYPPFTHFHQPSLGVQLLVRFLNVAMMREFYQKPTPRVYVKYMTSDL